MMFLLQKRLFCLFPCNNSSIYLSSYQLCGLFNFSTATYESSEHSSNFIVVNPLQSCELSSEKAAKAAKYHTCRKNSSSLSIEFFKQNGWSDAQVMKLTQKAPKLLRAKVETTLKPRMRSLQDMGFSVAEIVQLVSKWPTILFNNIQPNLNFLRSLLGSNERLLIACRRNGFLLNSNLPRKIEPNISLLRECGISNERIARMVVTMPSFVVRKSKFIKEVIEHVEELGVPRDCGMFPHALLVVMNVSRSKCDATFATFKSFGWSQPDIIAILRKSPFVWKLSKKNVSDKMTFLMKEAGCELQYIISHPVLLSLSLEKRLRPRHEVINFLEQNKLLDKGHSLIYVLTLTEQKFINKYLFPYKEKFTALYYSYVAAVQGKQHVVVEN
uniref:Mitochondrial transcription termination factor family protein n=1 Tax=Musa acuminata subsp. malaccensis TaxID=214687 RepID=A0A804L244_MUSAM|nr:PREDICTED: transcription termination factor MTERF2, chloroplastic-like isoform X6 [Musa acuminata subsp. malaccensis]XP_018674841.1 PREDICTED: transcription termination factor MTERF2, chloroplastic-like isoform X6 [Musa acuminata subsp. malaccensis]